MGIFSARSMSVAVLPPETRSDRWRPRGRVAGRERFSRGLLHEIVAAPRRAFDHLVEPPPRLRQVALTGERPPGEAAAEAGEHAAGPGALPNPRQPRPPPAAAEENPRRREPFPRSIPAPSIPDA